jgi:hypothetical protein
MPSSQYENQQFFLLRRFRDLPEALVFDQGVREKFEVEGVGEYQQPRCKNCRSLEVSFAGLNRPVDYTRALLGGTLALHRSLWECDSCGHQWPESNEKTPDNFLTSASSILLVLIALEKFSGALLAVIAAGRLAASR